MPIKPSLILVTALTGLHLAHAAPIRKIVPQGATSFTSKAGGFSIWLPFCPHAESESSLNNRGERFLLRQMAKRQGRNRAVGPGRERDGGGLELVK